MKTTIQLNYTIVFKDGGWGYTAKIKTNNIIYAIKTACKKAELSSDYIVSIEAN